MTTDLGTYRRQEITSELERITKKIKEVVDDIKILDRHQNKTTTEENTLMRLKMDLTFYERREQHLNEELLENLEEDVKTPNLEFSQFSTHKYFERSIKLANRWLNSRDFQYIYNRDYRSSVASSWIRQISIQFSDQIPKIKDGQKGPVYSWIDRALQTRSIFINQVFKEKLDLIVNDSQKKKEKDCIEFFFAVLLIHELGHALIRWTGQQTSPTLMVSHTGSPEAGFHLETTLFNSVIYLLTSRNEPFNKHLPIEGLAIRKGNFVFQIDQDHIQKSLNIEKPIETLLRFEINNEPVRSDSLHTLSRSGNDDELDDNHIQFQQAKGTVIERVCVQTNPF